MGLLQNAAKLYYLQQMVQFQKFSLNYFLTWYTGVVRHSELLQKGFFYRNHQVAAKCCKIVSFAANGITSKVLQQLLPNLIYRASLAFWIDSEWFLSQKMMVWCKMLQNSIFCSKSYKFRNIAVITSKLGMHGLLGILNWFKKISFTKIFNLLQNSVISSK